VDSGELFKHPVRGPAPPRLHRAPCLCWFASPHRAPCLCCFASCAPFDSCNRNHAVRACVCACVCACVMPGFLTARWSAVRGVSRARGGAADVDQAEHLGAVHVQPQRWLHHRARVRCRLPPRIRYDQLSTTATTTRGRGACLSDGGSGTILSVRFAPLRAWSRSRSHVAHLTRHDGNMAHNRLRLQALATRLRPTISTLPSPTTR